MVVHLLRNSIQTRKALKKLVFGLAFGLIASEAGERLNGSFACEVED